MKWGTANSGLIQIVRAQIQETSSDPITDELIKRYGHLCQKQVAEIIPGIFETERTFSTTAVDRMYSITTNLGPDLNGIYFLTMDGYRTTVTYEERFIDKTYRAGRAGQWALRGRENIVFDSTPGAVFTVACLGHRVPPSSVLEIYHNAGTSATAAVAQKVGNTLTLTITGGANAGAYGFNVTATSTLTDLVDAINLISKGFTAALTGDCTGTELGTKLEDFASTSCYAIYLNLYLNPLLQSEWELHLINGMCMHCYRQLGERDKAGEMSEAWAAGVQNQNTMWSAAQRGFDSIPMQDSYGGLPPQYVRLGVGGWIVGGTEVD